jgi:predicted transcriptional regulator of viral defense system
MDDIVLTSTLRTQGYDARDVRRLRQRGDLVQLRRGAYAREQARERSVDQAHRDLIRATIPQLRDDAVVSHASAAVLHGLPVWSKGSIGFM